MSTATADALSLERKIKMHEAREAIINRLAPGLREGVDLDRFLRAVVAELGRMMEVDRCNVLRLTPEGTLAISHEWRASDRLASTEGATIPVRLDELPQLAAQLGGSDDRSAPLRFDDLRAPDMDKKIRQLAASLGTRALLIVPIALGEEVLGFVGLHMTRQPRAWHDEEVAFLHATARQIAVGYQYARLYTDKQREADRTHALLEIANALNARSDFKEVTALVLDRALELLGADYGALGVINETGKAISLADFRSAPHADTERVRQLIAEHGSAIDITAFPALTELLTEDRTLTLMDASLPLPIRLVFNATLGARAALVAPVHIGEQIFGLLGFVWSEPRTSFERYEIAIAKGIADQIGTALQRDQLSAEVMQLRSVLHERRTEDRIIGQAPAIRRAIELALNVADTSTSVLIQGESGTGKELFANLIHYNSPRRANAYVKLNCGAIPETLLESELFGHERGAFTDARARRVGKFEEADGGTLFLDEIGEMSMSAQVRLLRVLQDGEFTRVGGNEVVKTDVRVVAASNVDLAQAVEHGRFRRDLFYRLSVFPVVLPALRERPEDIHPLVIHFVEHYKNKTGRFISGISRDAIAALTAYEWRGNVRELENAIERAVIIASGRSIELEDLSDSIGGALLAERRRERQAQHQARHRSDTAIVEIELPITMDAAEQRIIRATLDYTKGDKSRTARLLEIGRKTLYRKLNREEASG